ncbi:MAG: orotidine 5'-phosphate decarboxylase, partial [Bacteroidota bacterium]
TSNRGAQDFQTQKIGNETLYQTVIQSSQTYNNAKNLMYVVGATQAAHLSAIRTIAPDHFLLVPGVGAQGGSLQEVCNYGMTANIGLLVNSSRGILYASKGFDFAVQAKEKAKALQQEMTIALEKVV